MMTFTSAFVLGFSFILAISGFLFCYLTKKNNFLFISVYSFAASFIALDFYFEVNLGQINPIFKFAAIGLYCFSFTLLFNAVSAQTIKFKSIRWLIIPMLFPSVISYYHIQFATWLILAVSLSALVYTYLRVVNTLPKLAIKALFINIIFLVGLVLNLFPQLLSHAELSQNLVLITVVLLGACYSYIIFSEYILKQQVLISDQDARLTKTEKEKLEYYALLQSQEEEYQLLEVEMQERNFELQETLRELQDKNSELEKINTIDALTQVKNRRFFDQKMLAEFRRGRREQSWLSIIMLDVDHFKSVNDEYGHLAGDQVLIYLAKVIKKLLCRPSDCLCRYGGEEFAIILPNTPSQGAFQVAENMRQAIESETFETSEANLNITASFGIATIKVEPSSDIEQTINSADKALYYSKKNGRNKVSLAEEVINLS
ncbi:GGDEF domain-containing protein [Catenovulum maritimum]|uniref:GGDEF domain-containing protein n=1 Tax=Catenovulum maritimum TaxID=1513271 RepID=UPI00065F8345|nr:GGDEF domain-containing protein [Catenovulum maritimum]